MAYDDQISGGNGMKILIFYLFDKFGSHKSAAVEGDKFMKRIAWPTKMKLIVRQGCFCFFRVTVGCYIPYRNIAGGIGKNKLGNFVLTNRGGVSEIHLSSAEIKISHDI